MDDVTPKLRPKIFKHLIKHWKNYNIDNYSTSSLRLYIEVARSPLLDRKVKDSFFELNNNIKLEHLHSYKFPSVTSQAYAVLPVREFTNAHSKDEKDRESFQDKYMTQAVTNFFYGVSKLEANQPESECFRLAPAIPNSIYHPLARAFLKLG